MRRYGYLSPKKRADIFVDVTKSTCSDPESGTAAIEMWVGTRMDGVGDITQKQRVTIGSRALDFDPDGDGETYVGIRCVHTDSSPE